MEGIEVQQLRLRDVMSASLVYVDMRATVTEAEKLMAAHNVHHLPVMDNGILESIISKRDIRHAIYPDTLSLEAADGGDKEDLLVSDICPIQAFVADVDDPLAKVIDIMVSRRIAAVIVLAEGELSGIFTEADGCRVLARVMQSLAQ
ncbi:CBS domain-containing protein [Exilibacterium tricleocarpae]|uniref:CBS domain-containing protein n=1 Tax=Exilibacterium tricleocarpae TaxID=2591008 RepID=A0A545SPN7_9GAMM|nr:CBS domain-containing protein [Exilibacterium tricleocarpae]TQV66945.1 CBS domain-containing protein [Exilibacterium tricleocarpae]